MIGPLVPKLPIPDWDSRTITETIATVVRAARNGDTETLSLLGRLIGHGGAQAVRGFFRAAIALEKTPDATHRFFERYWIGMGDTLRRLANDDDLVLDALRKLTRPYTGPQLTLWRGESVVDFENGNLGISWTTDPEAASTFGRWHPWNRRGGLVILEVIAPTDAIICRLRSGDDLADRMLQETLVDRRRLSAPPTVTQQFGEEQNIIGEALAIARQRTGNTR